MFLKTNMKCFQSQNFKIYFFLLFYSKNNQKRGEYPLYNEIETLINNRLSQETIYPELITITKIHDTNHVDCKNETNTTFQYIQCIGTPIKGQQGLMFTLNDDTLIIITK